jgi:diguanylate cyclase (GGDEF)-like protein
MSSSPQHLARKGPTEQFVELIIDTLQQLEPAAKSAFLQKFLKGLAGVRVSEKESLNHWEGILRRRTEMLERLGRPVALSTAVADYFGSSMVLRNPILVEYADFKRLHHDASTDSLTGLYNRRLFEEYLTRELNRARRYAAPLTLLLFDLRNFKKANDARGHPNGDEILRTVASAFSQSIRGADYGFRIGGDEFALLLPQSESENGHRLAQRITQKFEQRAQALAPEVGLGLDYGLAAFPKNGESAKDLFSAADRNLYANKEQARVGKATKPVEPKPDEPDSERQDLSATARNESSEKRRSNRIPGEEVGARGVLRIDDADREARVADLGFGGVGFFLDEAITVPEVFYARLHIPPFQDSKLKFRRVYGRPFKQGLVRVGCSFIT